jgi:phage tail sheath protein FI
MYKHPGVYIEHVPSGLLAIEAASTSTAAFIGPVKRGPVGKPIFVSSRGQYEDQFGLLGGGSIRDEGDKADRFGFAVNAFFANGGSKAYIVRVAENKAGSLKKASTAIPNPDDTQRGFKISAVNEGRWGNDLQVRLTTTDPGLGGNNPDLDLGYTLEVGIEQDGTFAAIETFTGLSMKADSGQFIEKVIEEGSKLIDIVGDTIANIGDVNAAGLRGAPIEINASGVVEIADKILDVVIGGGAAVRVTFERDTGDLAALADHIQSTVRAGNSDAPDFSVMVETDGTDKRLLLASGLLGAAGAVTTPDPGTGTARPKLGLNSTTAPNLPPDDLATSGAMMRAWLTGGGDGEDKPAVSEYDDAYTTLRDYRDVSIILLPAVNWLDGGDNSIVQNAVTHCEFMKNRMVIIDPPDPVGNAKLISPKDVKDLGAPTSPYTSLYYPWLEVSNPHYDPDTAANKPRTFRVPPSAFAAGLWARIDGRRGVWKAPAGLEATVRGSIGPNILIGNDLQDNLNDQGINCLRSIIGPTVIWGARTLATRSKPEFRYVPVRRTQNMIGESLYRALQAVVFEPNDHRLWSTLRASVGSFMDGLHRAGAFQGEKASDAYYVQCGKGTTMTQGDIDAGIVRVVVGFAPLKPAEFVVVQIKQIVGQTR